MAASRLILDIPEPCAESWQEMTPVAGGRHCTACAKTVIDFTAYSDAELIRFFSQLKDTAICCRLQETQVNRGLQVAPRPSFLRVQWQRMAALLLAAQALTTQAKAQYTRRTPATSVPVPRHNRQQELKGQLFTFEGGRPPEGLSFRLQLPDGDSILVSPDSAGYFSILLPPAFKEGLLSWSRQQAGPGFIIADSAQVFRPYELMRVYWQRTEVLDRMVVEISHTRTLGGAPVATFGSSQPRKRSFFQRLTSVFHKKQH